MTNDNITVAIDRLSDDKKNTAYPLNVCDSAFWDDIALVCKQARLAQRYREALEMAWDQLTNQSVGRDQREYQVEATLRGALQHD